MLQVAELNAYYGKSHILQGVTFHIEEGEIVSLLGRNGVGRSTTCKAIMGDVAPFGQVQFKGQEIAGKNIASDLEDQYVMFLRNHGTLTCGKTGATTD